MRIEYVVKAACTDLENVPSNGKITSIDGEDVLSICNKCKKPILKSDIHSYHNKNDVFYCIKCGNSV